MNELLKDTIDRGLKLLMESKTVSGGMEDVEFGFASMLLNLDRIATALEGLDETFKGLIPQIKNPEKVKKG